MSVSYTWQKFHSAILVLDPSTGSIQERLCNAGFELLRLHGKDDLPEQMRDEFEEIERKLAAVEPSGDESSIGASTNAMTDDKACNVAEKIVFMYNEIMQMYGAEMGAYTNE